MLCPYPWPFLAQSACPELLNQINFFDSGHNLLEKGSALLSNAPFTTMLDTKELNGRDSAAIGFLLVSLLLGLGNSGCGGNSGVVACVANCGTTPTPTPGPATPTPTPVPNHAVLFVGDGGPLPGLSEAFIQDNGSVELVQPFPLDNPFNIGAGGVFLAGRAYFQVIPNNTNTKDIMSFTVDFQTGKYEPASVITQSNGVGGPFLMACQNRFLVAHNLPPPGENPPVTPLPIETFSIDSSGTMHASSGPVTVDSTTTSIVVDPTCRFLFALSQDGIFSYAIDSATAGLTLVPGSPFVFPGNNPVGGTVEDTGSFLYGVSALGVTSYVIGPNGSLTAASKPVSLPTTGTLNSALIVRQGTSQFLYVSVLSQTTPPAITGYRLEGSVITVIADPGTISGFNIPSLVSYKSFLYAIDFLNRSIWGYLVNPDGTLTTVPGSPFVVGAPAPDHPLTAVVAPPP